MGVFHLSGLGLNPGAVTSPLTIVYEALKEKIYGNNKEAISFFETSGEIENPEEISGPPEGIIVFSSQEVVDGVKKPNRPVVDCLFNKNFSNAGVLDITFKYLEIICDKWKLLSPKYFVAVKVDHQNFDDCFEKAYITFKALLRKEVWINLTGGSNQINLSLMLASLLTNNFSKMYYVFEDKVEYLHPSNVTKKSGLEEYLKKWNELPILPLDLSPLLNKLKQKNKIYFYEFKELFPGIKEDIFKKTILIKLIGSRIILREKDHFIPGPMFLRIKKVFEKIDEIENKMGEKLNLSVWKKYIEENNLGKIVKWE